MREYVHSQGIGWKRVTEMSGRNAQGAPIKVKVTSPADVHLGQSRGTVRGMRDVGGTRYIGFSIPTWSPRVEVGRPQARVKP